jgi:drug/metabolite transporter (DMT)-like permease
MRPAPLVGALLIVIGIVVLSLGGFSFTRREKVADVGPIEVTAEREHTVPVAPIAGALAIVGGIVLLVTGRRRVS